MAYTIRKVEYFSTVIKDQPGEAYVLLTQLAKLGVNLLALTAVPIGPATTQMTLFPHDSGSLTRAAAAAGMQLSPPQPALLVQGDDEMGALTAVHRKLTDARVNVYASTAVADGRGAYGYIIYVRPDDCDRALEALKE